MEINSIVRTKKNHACGNNLWKVIFIGADIKLKCEKCEHIVLISRSKTKTIIKEILHVT